MAKGYWIAHITVTDPEAFKGYAPLSGPAIANHGGRYIIRGGKPSPGQPSGSRYAVRSGAPKDRHIVVEFDSYEAALACYNSPEYQRAIAVRDRSCQIDIVVIGGFEA